MQIKCPEELNKKVEEKNKELAYRTSRLSESLNSECIKLSLFYGILSREQLATSLDNINKLTEELNTTIGVLKYNNRIF